MSSLKNELMTGEEIVYLTKPHWIVFSAPILWFISAIAIYLLGYLYNVEWLRIGDMPPLYQIFSWVCFGLAAVSGIIASTNYLVTDYAVTNRRVLMRTGLIRRITSGILLQKIELIKVFQSILGRILGYGSVVIVGTGGTHDPFPNLPNPLVFRQKVQSQIHQ